MRIIHVWYHANCWDGFGAAWAVHVAAKERDLGELRFREVQYGAPLPDHADESEIWFLDFAPKDDQLDELLACDEVKRVLIIDHHKTALEALKNFKHPKLEAHFNIEHSGAWMAWRYFVHDAPTSIPTLIRYIEDRDLWLWELPKSKEFNANLRSHPRSFRVWDEFNEKLEDPDDFRQSGFAGSFEKEGAAIIREQERVVRDHLRNIHQVLIAGHSVPCVNATTYFSEIAGRLAEQNPDGVGAAFFVRGDGRYQYSLRSTGKVDVSAIAKEYGGGGHAGAAGFEVNRQLSASGAGEKDLVPDG